MKTKISALIIITTLFLGCKKTIFGVGNESKKTIELNEYSEIVLNSSFDIELIPDIKDYAEITAGEKIINDIKLKIKSNRLTINDYSNYNWIKGLNIPKIKLHYTNIDSILITEACKIRNSDIIKSDTKFKIRSTTPFTDIKLNIDVNRLNIITAEKQEGYIILSGKATHCLIANYGTATLDTRDLYSESMDIYHNNISSCYVRAKSWARVIICRKGDVYMYGQPPTIERIQHGTGNLHLIGNK